MPPIPSLPSGGYLVPEGLRDPGPSVLDQPRASRSECQHRVDGPVPHLALRRRRALPAMRAPAAAGCGRRSDPLARDVLFARRVLRPAGGICGRRSLCLSPDQCPNPSPTSLDRHRLSTFTHWRHAPPEWLGSHRKGLSTSHPNGPSHPSKTDLALANEPDWVYLIVAGGEISGWMMRNRRAEAVAVDLG